MYIKYEVLKVQSAKDYEQITKNCKLEDSWVHPSQSEVGAAPGEVVGTSTSSNQKSSEEKVKILGFPLKVGSCGELWLYPYNIPSGKRSQKTMENHHFA